jgi:hypothetical protein
MRMTRPAAHPGGGPFCALSRPVTDTSHRGINLGGGSRRVVTEVYVSSMGTVHIGARLMLPHAAGCDGSSNTTVTNPIGSVTFACSSYNHSLWAKGDLNPHVPKDTGT